MAGFEYADERIAIETTFRTACVALGGSALLEPLGCEDVGPA